MKLLLSSVSTDKLEEAFNRYIGRVLKEEVAAEPKEQKTEAPVVVTEAVKPEVKAETKVVTGNEALVEELNDNKDDEQQKSQLLRLKELAGI